MIRLLFLGGYPKNYPAAFHPNSFSGKRLRAIVAKHEFEDVKYADLWIDRLQEEEGTLWPSVEEFLISMMKAKYTIVALGKVVQKSLDQNTSIKFIALPHPASRRKIDLNRLEDGISNLVFSGDTDK